MNIEAHAAVGWVLANLGGQTSRRYRAAVFLAALAPDLDALSKVFGDQAYASCHHVLGHNIFAAAAISLLAAALVPRFFWRVLAVTQLAVWSHFLGDYFLTRFPQQWLWPVADRGFLFGYRIGLDHPVNLVLNYLSLASMLLLARWLGRTPLEFLWPALDARISRLLMPRPWPCAMCGRPANETCERCGQHLCRRHARLTRRCGIVCHTCPSAPAVLR